MSTQNAVHTPGPWSIGESNGDEIEVLSDAMHGRDYPIAIVLSDDEEDATDPIPQANATLIAAAPELLDALTRILGSLEFDERLYGTRPERSTVDFPRAIEIARAAIAKATGAP